MKRTSICLVFILALALLAGCGKPAKVCPVVTGTPQYLTTPPEALPTVTPSSPSVMQIGGQTLTVDKVVSGPLCNDTWSGTVYVSCNVQVYAWELSPDFLKNCNLKIDPDTVVYVAYHNDTAYYNGCSCHTGTESQP